MIARHAGGNFLRGKPAGAWVPNDSESAALPHVVEYERVP